jgi:flavin reductase (DIM6/NTAB) family NADH-FMN oxidoreductase RutF
MRKKLDLTEGIFPMPVLMVAAYDENEKVNVMNVAWGQICGADRIYLCIGKGKKTLSNIQKSKAFTVSLADAAHMDVADYYGLVSGNNVEDKFEKTGYTAVKSDKVHAPIIDEFPVAIECEFLEELDTEFIHGVVGRIIKVKAEESVLAEDGKVDVMKLNALMFDNSCHGYYSVGKKEGQAWDAGMDLMK